MNRIILAATVAAAFIGSAAQAATTYPSRTTFDAVGGGTAYSTAIDGTYALTMAGPFTVGPLQFSSNALYVPASATTAGANGAPNSSDWIQFQLDTGGSAATISNSAGFRLIGFDIRPYQTDLGETIRFTANTGETGIFVLPTTNVAGFLGIAFATSVTSVTFAATTGGLDGFYSWFGTDNYQTYSALASAVREPSTWLTMIVGFGIAGAAMRRRPVSTPAAVAA